MDAILADGGQTPFCDLNPREQERQARRVRAACVYCLFVDGGIVGRLVGGLPDERWASACADDLSPSPFFSSETDLSSPQTQVFEEMKRGAGGIRLQDLAYSLRAVGLDLSDRQARRLLPGLYGKC